MRRGDHFVHGGKAWCAECDSFSAGGAAGEIVQARRLEWSPPYEVATHAGRATLPAGAHPYGAKEPLAVGPSETTTDFDDLNIFDPDDAKGDDFGLFDRAKAEDDPERRPVRTRKRKAVAS